LYEPLPHEAAKRVLLLDCDDRRRELRAEALANRGALVDGVAGSVAARMLWKPGSHDLVLVDLRGAEADFETFMSFVNAECGSQKVGFYVAQPPYLTSSAAQCRCSLEQEALRQVAEAGRVSEGNVRSGGTGLSVAAKRIKAVRRLARVRAYVPEERREQAPAERPSGVPVSAALSLAARILGGS